MKELGETKDLLGLLAKSVAQPLSDEEDARAKAQLVDVVKAVPALAIFAAPGGAFLLPLVVKYLRLELRPSSFVDDVKLGDEARNSAHASTTPDDDTDGSS